jgi:hypothetical protein
MKDPDPSGVATTEDLAQCLLQLHIRADRPSLRTLEQQTGMSAGRPLAGGGLKSVRLGRTNLHDVLNGHKFPKKAFLLTFVEVCGIDVAADRRWEEAWNRIASQSDGHIAAQDHDPRQRIA